MCPVVAAAAFLEILAELQQRQQRDAVARDDVGVGPAMRRQRGLVDLRLGPGDAGRDDVGRGAGHVAHGHHQRRGDAGVGRQHVGQPLDGAADHLGDGAVAQVLQRFGLGGHTLEIVEIRDVQVPAFQDVGRDGVEHRPQRIDDVLRQVGDLGLEHVDQPILQGIERGVGGDQPVHHADEPALHQALQLRPQQRHHDLERDLAGVVQRGLALDHHLQQGAVDMRAEAHPGRGAEGHVVVAHALRSRQQRRKPSQAAAQRVACDDGLEAIGVVDRVAGHGLVEVDRQVGLAGRGITRADGPATQDVGQVVGAAVGDQQLARGDVVDTAAVHAVGGGREAGLGPQIGAHPFQAIGDEGGVAQPVAFQADAGALAPVVGIHRQDGEKQPLRDRHAAPSCEPRTTRQQHRRPRSSGINPPSRRQPPAPIGARWRKLAQRCSGAARRAHPRGPQPPQFRG